ncbi:NADP-dependent oxidoreductase [Undibacterium sp. TS12]|uniref:MDR family NADP-dependent oxidoreductase n=1 Tax=Undibacterium sp. TS12 TaxID=2908202 RepID=UPI001F4CE9B7|nr:NADP-dependent oxidoreductase [Undibacterium sp. TS12]MCH8622252.1 NADP-dependent oxidoreductase [Undibacterium sp. TS12]
MSSLPVFSREVRLKSRPVGLPLAGHFEVIDTPVPVPAQGEVLIRNLYSRVSASLRMMISEGASDVEGVPFPCLQDGATLAEEALGEVVSAPPDCGLLPGHLVLHFAGWRDYSVLSPTACTLIRQNLPDPAAHLSHGWTAYAALTRGVQIRAGDTVLITSAAGAIGSMAGQIARALGAGRVIGSTSSADKAKRLTGELGYDAIVLRGARESFLTQLGKAAPDGIDVVLDSVGGEQLQAALALANPGAHILVTGALSGQLASQGSGRVAPVELDSFQILLKKIRLQGYSADDDVDARTDWNRHFVAWQKEDRICFPHVLIAGLQNGPLAIQNIADGKYFGTVLIRH